MWILKWANSNRLLALVIVALFLVASASAVDSYRTRKLLKAAQTNLEESAKAKEKELSEAQKAWEKRESDADRKLAPVLRERDALRAKLAGLEARASVPFDAPDTDDEIVARFQALGYSVRVRR